MESTKSGSAAPRPAGGGANRRRMVNGKKSRQWLFIFVQERTDLTRRGAYRVDAVPPPVELHDSMSRPQHAPP